jgi:hypothetical protein
MKTNEEIVSQRREIYLNNKEKIKEKRKNYYLKNKEKTLEKNKKYYENNIKEILKHKKEYYKVNIENKKEYYLNNRESLIQNGIEYKKKKYCDDSLYKLSQNIRNLIRESLKRKNYSKKSKAQSILGCSFEEFKIYLESKFEPWMNWLNHGNWNGEPIKINTAWDIDHIIPLSSATNEEEILKLNHYTNLQPLCSYTNRHIKSNHIDFTE